MQYMNVERVKAAFVIFSYTIMYSYALCDHWPLIVWGGVIKTTGRSFNLLQIRHSINWHSC